MVLTKRKLETKKRGPSSHDDNDVAVDNELQNSDIFKMDDLNVNDGDSSDEDSKIQDESDNENDPGPVFDSEEDSEISEKGSDIDNGSDESNDDDDDDEDEDEEEEEEEEEERDDNEKDSTVDNEKSMSEKESDEDDTNDNVKSKPKKVQSSNREMPKSRKIKAHDLNAASSSGESTKTDETKVDEYEDDTSDEEDIRNTVGNIPMNWYDDYPHLGYDWDGKRILKPEKSDQIDEFLRKMEDPDFWRSVSDSQTGQKVILSDADLELISRMQNGKVPDSSYDEYAPWVEWFTSKVMQMPIRGFPDQKRSFLPSKTEKEKVSKLVHALKMGWIKPEAEKRKERRKMKEPKFYLLWKTEENEHLRRIHNHIPAPKRALPGNAESYNPPEEYLFDKLEMKEWEKQAETPWKRKLHFLPQKHNSLREVPAYDKFVHERFQRCLDLYLCPRGRKMRLAIEPEELIPKLPSPKDLQPFPTVLSIVYSGHTDIIRSISVDPKGQYLVSGSDDTTVKVWEVSTGRCLTTIPCGGIVRSVSWCPSQAISLILVAADKKVLLINPGLGDTLVVSKTDTLLEEAPPAEKVAERISAAVQWEQPEASSDEYKNGIRIIVNHFKEVTQISWHGRGDYFSSLMPEAQQRSVLIHQLSRRRSQMPFNKNKGRVQSILFHPIRPLFFVAFQRNIRIYDLVKQELVKKLTSTVAWISSIAIHPNGDNVLVGTYDRKLLWYDLDLSTAPYQTLRLHSGAVRGVAYHKRYPLFASASDDKSVIVSHGMVYSDLLQNPLLVPLKRLAYHNQVGTFSVLDVHFHPTQPWLFSSGADGTVRLYT